MNKSKNDKAWECIFEKYEIINALKDGEPYMISAKQINEFREARLMTKFDHKSQLPKIFSKHDLSILPTSRGGYIIGPFKTFSDFNKDEIEVSPVEFPTHLESIDYKDITSEATAINCAFVSRILHHFTGEDELYPTVSGRMSSSTFDFDITSSMGEYNIKVSNSQVEIDGGYEGANSLHLIEAKNYISEDYLIRQLYYPFRLWNDKIHKAVRPIFLTYSNGIFHLREYTFKETNHYNSVHLLKHKKYIVEDGSFNIEVLIEIIDRTVQVTEPEIPFPQADSFERVINLCELLKQKNFIPKEEITENYDFDPRQTDYYSNAGRYLGLIAFGKDPSSGQRGCFLTSRGEQVFSLNLAERQKEFVRLIVSHSVFNMTLKLFLDDGEMPDKPTIVEIMKQSNLYNVRKESTYLRRSSTIIGWLNWIIDQIEE